MCLPKIKNIPDSIYELLLEYAPRICIDIVILCDNSVLLLRRNNEPNKDCWSLPGGRILRNEQIADAIQRRILEELGISINILALQFIGIYEWVLPLRHDISLTFKITLKSQPHIILDAQHSEYGWFRLANLPMPLDAITLNQIMEDGQNV